MGILNVYIVAILLFIFSIKFLHSFFGDMRHFVAVFLCIHIDQVFMKKGQILLTLHNNLITTSLNYFHASFSFVFITSKFNKHINLWIPVPMKIPPFSLDSDKSANFLEKKIKQSSCVNMFPLWWNYSWQSQ